MVWRVVTWNLDWWNGAPRRVQPLELLGAYAPHVALLQEVKGKSLRDGHDGPSVFSQEMHPGANWSWMGCAVLLCPGTEILERGVVETLPKPQRSAWARIVLPGGLEITVVSWHAPNRAGDGLDTKMAAFAAMSKWLATAKTPIVLGADLNTWFDEIDPRPSIPGEDHEDEAAFVGPEPRHRLVDAYRRLLENRGELEDRRLREAKGPLAVSHVLSNGVGHRMDRIYMSADGEVLDGGYDLEGGRAAGSDHALHWIDLDIHPEAGIRDDG